MKHILLPVFSFLSVLCPAAPDTLTKGSACGKYVFAYLQIYKEIRVKRNHAFVFVAGENGSTIKGRWEIKNDTLFVTDGKTTVKKLVMHNGKIALGRRPMMITEFN